MGTVSALDLGLLLLFLQMMSMGSYLLVVLVRKQRLATEASLKFFLYGGAALAVMAYGLTFLYGLTGSLSLPALGRALQGSDPAWLALAAGLVLVGFAFEATLLPFHFWAPDVYAGSTAPVAGFVAVVPKTAAFGALLRFVQLALPGGLADWPLVLAVVAAATMTVRNLAALRQARLKPLLAWSSIAQAGYLLMALSVAGRTPAAAPALGYYLAAYLFMNLGVFAVVAQVERALGTDALAAFRGLGRRAPWPAAALALCLFSLAGIPPLAGFAGKVALLAPPWREEPCGWPPWRRRTWPSASSITRPWPGRCIRTIPRGWIAPPRAAASAGAVGLATAGTLMLGLFPGPGFAFVQALGRLAG